MEPNHFSSFGNYSIKKHFCEIILKSGNWSRRRCHLKAFSSFSSGGHFVEGNETTLATLVEGHPSGTFLKKKLF